MRISTSLINQRGVTGILNQQAGLSDIQKRIASGRRILTPSDDPSGAAQVVRLTQARSLTEQYQRNISQAQNRLNLEEISLEGVENTLLRVRELTLQANNSVLTDQDRFAIAREMKERVDELLGLANARDANGDFLFSGYQVTTKPFSQQADGSFTYNGDQGNRQLQVSQERVIADSDSGLRVFMDITQGNGTFQVGYNSGNTGLGIIDPGTLFDKSAYVADDYTINIVTNANGNPAYNVIGAASGQVIPPLPLDAVNDAPDFISDTAIRFNGIETAITSMPAAGDSFTVTPSSSQDIFTIVDRLANALNRTTFDDADVSGILNISTRTILDIDQAFEHITEYRAGIGARLNTLDTQKDVNESFLLEVNTTLSETQDLDLIAAISELQQRSAALQAAQASFARIQGLSLFNYL